VITTPLLLIFTLPSNAAEILAFMQRHTVYVDGLGDVCDYALFDMASLGETSATGQYNGTLPSRTHPNTAQPSSHNGLFTREHAVDYKVESSFLSFRTQHPDWDFSSDNAITANNNTTTTNAITTNAITANAMPSRYSDAIGSTGYSHSAMSYSRGGTSRGDADTEGEVLDIGGGTLHYHTTPTNTTTTTNANTTNTIGAFNAQSISNSSHSNHTLPHGDRSRNVNIYSAIHPNDTRSDRSPMVGISSDSVSYINRRTGQVRAVSPNNAAMHMPLHMQNHSYTPGGVSDSINIAASMLRDLERYKLDRLHEAQDSIFASIFNGPMQHEQRLANQELLAYNRMEEFDSYNDNALDPEASSSGNTRIAADNPTVYPSTTASTTSAYQGINAPTNTATTAATTIGATIDINANPPGAVDPALIASASSYVPRDGPDMVRVKSEDSVCSDSTQESTMMAPSALDTEDVDAQDSQIWRHGGMNDRQHSVHSTPASVTAAMQQNRGPAPRDAMTTAIATASAPQPPILLRRNTSSETMQTSILSSATASMSNSATIPPFTSNMVSSPHRSSSVVFGGNRSNGSSNSSSLNTPNPNAIQMPPSGSYGSASTSYGLQYGYGSSGNSGVIHSAIAAAGGGGVVGTPSASASARRYIYIYVYIYAYMSNSILVPHVMLIYSLYGVAQSPQFAPTSPRGGECGIYGQ
jgi:hypothetical protein